MARVTLGFALFASPVAGRSDFEDIPLLHGLSHELAQEFPQEAEETIGQALLDALQSAAEQESVSQGDLVCIRDYASACPKEWSDAGDGETCLAPLGYEGSCPKTFAFGKSPSEKGQNAIACETEFPCAGVLPQDYSKACPASWVKDLDSACVAPESYSGTCVARKSFVGFTASEKKAWGEKCGVSWPARATLADRRKDASNACSADYTKACPQGWLLSGSSCIATSAYEGECGMHMRATLSPSQKKAIEDACSVSWC